MTESDSALDGNESQNPSISMDGLDDEDVGEVVQNVFVQNGEDEMTLEAAMLDLAVAHKELDEYKNGALALYQHLDERQHEAECADNEQVAEVIEEVKKTAYGVYLRLQRGEAELMGDRDGKFSGYFDPDEETPTPDDDPNDATS